MAILLLLGIFSTIIILAYEFGVTQSETYRKDFEKDLSWAEANAGLIDGIERLTLINLWNSEDQGEPAPDLKGNNFEIKYLDAKIPINRFVESETSMELLARYFQAVNPDSDQTPIALANTLKDWIDTDDELGNGSQSERSVYNSPPPLNRNLRNLHELLAIPGFERFDPEALIQHIRFDGTEKMALQGMDTYLLQALFLLPEDEAQLLSREVLLSSQLGVPISIAELMAERGQDIQRFENLLTVNSKLFEVVGLGSRVASEVKIHGVFSQKGNRLSLQSLNSYGVNSKK